MKISNKKIQIFVLILCSVLFVCFSSVLECKAQSVKGLAIEPVYSKNQIQKNGILNPKVKENTEQKLSFNIINFSDKTEKVTISANTAATSGYPSIYFSDNYFLNDTKKEFNFNKLFKKSKITKYIKPNEVNKISFTAKVPKEHFPGVISGGFYIDNNLKTNDKNGGTNIDSKYTYVMPVILREDKKLSKPNLSLGKVEGSDLYNNPKILSTLYNDKPASIYNMDVNTKVINKENKLIVDQSVKSTKVAPNTHFTMSNLVNEDKLTPGKYKIKIKADSNQGKWLLEKSFTIGVGQYLGSTIQRNMLLFVILILLLLLMILIVIYLLYKRFKKVDEE